MDKLAHAVVRNFLDRQLAGRVAERFASDKIDHSLAESEGHKGQARFDDNKKQHTEMKSLLKKVEDANPGAKKKFDAAYDKMFENGEKAAAAGKKLLQKYEDAADHYKGSDKHQIEAALSMIERTIHQWENNKIDHHKAKGALAGQKMHQGENTYGYAQELESLKEPDMEVDDSWRNH